MEISPIHFYNSNRTIFDPIDNLKRYFQFCTDLIIWNSVLFSQTGLRNKQTLDFGMDDNSDPFASMTKKCIPTFTNNTSAIRKTVYYSGLPFPEEDLKSPSFNDSSKFYNLIVDDTGSLLKLVFQITGAFDDIPPGQMLLEVQEYTIPGQPVLARKFIGYKN